MIQKLDSNKFSLTILKVTTFSRIRQETFMMIIFAASKHKGNLYGAARIEEIE